eukprot:Protomagalhaensia_wolfi_Nauph_80__1004@NODE_1580_length_1456_cov_84_179958_g653_i1_p1_GENE_NODE_1580_length_1456_cov_84_179958_g653_i1NODE_1580_length_1456_cov_84_179958_g653_i1_p1_ORF_typecomplete_len115_score9_26_NODE_1580_length_1456_cov_84_179958_g653_i110571401
MLPLEPSTKLRQIEGVEEQHLTFVLTETGWEWHDIDLKRDFNDVTRIFMESTIATRDPRRPGQKPFSLRRYLRGWPMNYRFIVAAFDAMMHGSSPTASKGEPSPYAEIMMGSML